MLLRLGFRGIGALKSTPEWRHLREDFAHCLGICQLKSFASTFVKESKDAFARAPSDGSEVDFSKITRGLFFRIFISLFFGRDISKDRTIEYDFENGTKAQVSLFDSIINLVI